MFRLGTRAASAPQPTTVELDLELRAATAASGAAVDPAGSPIRLPAEVDPGAFTPLDRGQLPIGSEVEVLHGTGLRWMRPDQAQLSYQRTVGVVVGYHDNGTPLILPRDPGIVGELSLEPFWRAGRGDGPIDYVQRPGTDGGPALIAQRSTIAGLHDLSTTTTVAYHRIDLPEDIGKRWLLYEQDKFNHEPAHVLLPPRDHDHNLAFAEQYPHHPDTVKLIDLDGRPLANQRQVLQFSAHGAPWGFDGIATKEAAEAVASVIASKNAGLPPEQRVRYVTLQSCSQGTPRIFGLFGQTNAQAFQRHLDAALARRGLDPSGPQRVTVLASERPGLLYGEQVKYRGQFVETRFVPAELQAPRQFLDPQGWATGVGLTVGATTLTAALLTEAGVVAWLLTRERQED